MSSNEAPHPNLGGKSLETAMANSRPPYKSWRKKFRKMRAKFDLVLEENRKLFKEEQKLESLARRLTEELDGLLEVLLDLNQQPVLPNHLRFDLSSQDDLRIKRQNQNPATASIQPYIDPQRADQLTNEYFSQARAAKISSAEWHLVRRHIQEQMSRQDSQDLPEADVDIANADEPEGHPAFLSAEQEDLYLSRIDNDGPDVKRPSHQAELTARELDRQMELLNPQSQHNWLRTHSKAQPVGDDEEAMSNEQGARSSKKRQSGKNLARQVMVDRMAREAFSPSEMSGMGDDDDEAYSKRRGTERDSTYRAKGSSKNGGSMKSTKRKRNTDEGAGGAKRVKASEIFD